jgi:hypothetical protein
MRRIVREALAGAGPKTIATRLNQEGIKPPGRGEDWHLSTLQYLLKSKTLIGEYQPGETIKDDDRRRWQPDGAPVKNYYPPLISDSEFYRLQGVIAARAVGARGRRGKTVSNIFGRVLVSGYDESTMSLTRKNTGISTMSSAKSLRGAAPFRGFHYPTFENVFLDWVTELKLEDDSREDGTVEIEGRLAEVQARIAKTQAAIDTGGNFDALLALLKRLGENEKQLKAELESSRSANNTKITDAANEVRNIRSQLCKLSGEELRVVRERLRTRIAQLCQRIRVWIDGDRVRRVCLTHVEFKNGWHRMFAIRTERGKPHIVVGTKGQVNPSRFNPRRVEASLRSLLVGATGKQAYYIAGKGRLRDLLA